MNRKIGATLVTSGLVMVLAVYILLSGTQESLKNQLGEEAALLCQSY